MEEDSAITLKFHSEYSTPDLAKHQLIASIQQRYSTKWHTVLLAKREYSFLVMANPEQILDELTLILPHDQLEIQPYWAQAWDAAFVLAEYCATNVQLKHTEILEIGCGMGITGSVAGSYGASVLMSDYAEPALPFAQVNSWPWQQNTAVQKINWRCDQLDKTFELIIGADVLYDRDEVPFIDRFCKQHLANNGTFLTADPNRAMTVEYINTLMQLGWNATIFQFQSSLYPKPFRIVKFTLDPDCK